MLRFLITGLVLIAGAGVFVLSFTSPQEESEVSYSISTIEIVDSFEERARGLSGRTTLPDDYGMLFVFETKDRYGFWMKDMLLPIDIIWLSDEGEILSLEERVSPESYPKSFYPTEPVRYVLETRAGLLKEKGWGEGTKLSLPLER